MPEVTPLAPIIHDGPTPGVAAAAPPSHGSRLDRWVDSYAARTRGMTASEIRALFAVASRPEVVSLAGGMPFLSALPMDMVSQTMSRLVTEFAPRRGREAEAEVAESH